MLPDANELVDTLKRAAVEAVEAGKRFIVVDRISKLLCLKYEAVLQAAFVSSLSFSEGF